MVKLSDTSMGEEQKEISPPPAPPTFKILVPQDKNKASFKLVGSDFFLPNI